MNSSLFKTTAEKIRQKKFSKNGIGLNILLIGENGCGKKKFINTLCNKKFFNDFESGVESINNFYKSKDKYNAYKLKFDTFVIDLVEPNSIPIKLKIYMTQNFGFNIENSKTSENVISFIEDKFNSILEEELKIKRNPRFEDNRIHVGLYFIRPTSKGLSTFDIKNMKEISERVNLIPVISKADTLTDDELVLNKKLINNAIKENNIKIFSFLNSSDALSINNSNYNTICNPENYSDANENLDDEDLQDLRMLQNTIPFSIINGDLINELGCQYRTSKLGQINVEDKNLCDFGLLKNVLFGSHLQEFKDITINKKYETFRVEQLMNQ